MLGQGERKVEIGTIVGGMQWFRWEIIVARTTVIAAEEVRSGQILNGILKVELVIVREYGETQNIVLSCLYQLSESDGFIRALNML